MYISIAIEREDHTPNSPGREGIRLKLKRKESAQTGIRSLWSKDFKTRNVKETRFS